MRRLQPRRRRLEPVERPHQCCHLGQRRRAGLGAAGGWAAAVAYVSLVGVLMLARWRSRAWEEMSL